MDREARRRSCLGRQRHCHVTGVAVPAEGPPLDAPDRQAGEHRHPVIAFLPIDLDVVEPELADGGEREGIVAALGFLQAEDVGAVPVHQLPQQRQAQPHRIDVPGGDREPQGHIGAGQQTPAGVARGAQRGKGVIGHGGGGRTDPTSCLALDGARRSTVSLAVGKLKSRRRHLHDLQSLYSIVLW